MPGESGSISAAPAASFMSHWWVAEDANRCVRKHYDFSSFVCLLPAFESQDDNRDILEH